MNASVERARPKSNRDLFISFTLLSLQGFGGVMAVVQRELVERKRWLTREEFIEDWAIAQTLPGPNVINLAVILGSRYYGAGGALAAFGGMMTAPLALILAIAILYAPFANEHHVLGALRGMGAVAAGLILATAIRMIGALSSNPLGRILCMTFAAASFIAVGVMRIPLAYSLFSLGGLACLLVWLKLKS